MMPIGRQIASGLSLPPAARRCSASAAYSGRSGSGSFMLLADVREPRAGHRALGLGLRGAAAERAEALPDAGEIGLAVRGPRGGRFEVRVCRRPCAESAASGCGPHWAEAMTGTSSASVGAQTKELGHLLLLSMVGLDVRKGRTQRIIAARVVEGASTHAMSRSSPDC